MALSEQEKKLLEQLEASLKADDPHLAETLSGTSHVRIHRRRATLAGIGFVLGLTALIGGIGLHWSISIAGFAIMLASAIVGISSWQRVGGDGDSIRSPEDMPDGPRSKASASSNKEFMDKLEERWRKRQQGDM